jgi:hypothetical protein
MDKDLIWLNHAWVKIESKINKNYNDTKFHEYGTKAF